MSEMRKCDYCGKLFAAHSSALAKIRDGRQKTLTCSRECAAKLKQVGEDIECDNCGKIFYRRKSHVERQRSRGEHQFCSLYCQKEFLHKETYEIRRCEICGKDFSCPKISVQRFCSIQCQGKWQSTQTGDLNPRSTKQHITCDWCGKDFLEKKYKLTVKGNHFCSIECRRKHYANVFSQADEWKEESCKRAVRILEEGKMPYVYTKPQIIVNSILDNIKMQYENNYNIVYYSIDNYLINSGLMIEVMGDYWHSNPYKFTYEKLNDVQRNRIPKDKAKHTYVLNNYGIEILYLWEDDIINRQDVCERLIEDYITNNGIMDNYHSFNYYMYENKLLLKDKIKYSYYDNTVN